MVIRRGWERISVLLDWGMEERGGNWWLLRFSDSKQTLLLECDQNTTQQYTLPDLSQWIFKTLLLHSLLHMAWVGLLLQVLVSAQWVAFWGKEYFLSLRPELCFWSPSHRCGNTDVAKMKGVSGAAAFSRMQTLVRWTVPESWKPTVVTMEECKNSLNGFLGQPLWDQHPALILARHRPC